MLFTYCTWNCTYQLSKGPYCLNCHHLELFGRSKTQPDFHKGDEKNIFDIKSTHSQIVHFCFNTQDQQSCLKTKADRILRAEGFLFTVFSLKNSRTWKRFNHAIFSLQLLVCNFLLGNFSFWEKLERRLVSVCENAAFSLALGLTQGYGESESPLSVRYGKKGNNTRSLSAVPSCKLFL